MNKHFTIQSGGDGPYPTEGERTHCRIELDNVSLDFPLHSAAKMAEVQNRRGVVPPTSDKEKLYSKNGRIRGVHALRNLSLTIGAGERVGLIGANGSGKTTLLQVLAGILPPSKGTVTITGRPTSLINIHLGLMPFASGHRNIMLRGLAAGQTRADIEEKRAEIVEFCQLGEFLDLPVSTYSAGMRMRLNFAIATAFIPEILILDEWLSAGDQEFKKNASVRMKEFVGQAGILVLASHGPDLLLKNCERCIWLENGSVELDGPIREVLHAYRAKRPPPLKRQQPKE
tara:strand:+ start:4821 stop:5678 length:858 start_codon:yes stop_codon:yes gene_type:complete